MRRNQLSGQSKPLLLKNTRILDPSRELDESGSVIIKDGKILAAGAKAQNQGAPDNAEVVDCKGAITAPGLVDTRVFMGEPGFEHRETLQSVSLAAASGGVTTIVTMPDTNPVIDDPALVDFVLRRARDTAVVNVHPMAAMTRGLEGREMTEIGLLREAGAIAVTDGRKSVRDAQVMRRILTYAHDFDVTVAHYAENSDLVGSGVMNEGELASRLGLPGIPREAEIIQLERDIRLVGLTGAKYHASQLSCGSSVDVISMAKDQGLQVTAAVSINHLTLNENDIGPYRTFFRMSPPLRAEEDRKAMVEAIRDGTVDIIVSSHDPQDVETKRHPFAEAEDGAIGLETLLSAALRLVHTEGIPILSVLGALTCRPASLYNLAVGTLKDGSPADLVVFNPDEPWIFTEGNIVSRSKNSPFEGARFQGRVLLTIVAGDTVFADPTVYETN